MAGSWCTSGPSPRSTPRPQWDTAEEAAGRALAWLLRNDVRATVVNVNVPEVPPDGLKGLRPARLAAFGAVQADVGETGEGFVTLTFSEVTQEPDPESDVALLREGWATVTALRAPCEARDVEFPGLDG